MKYLSFFSTFLLVVTISACSSGSSDEPEASTSTNTVPATDNSSDAGESAGPSDDQPTSAGDNDTGTADTEGTVDATDSGDSGSAESSEGNDTGNTEQNDDAAADSTGGSDTDGGTDTSGDGDTSGNGNGQSDGSEIVDTVPEPIPEPVIDPASKLGKIQSRINTLTGRALVAFNQLLSQGEMLTTQEEQCLGTYDPGIGQPLMSINCDQPWASGEVEIFAGVASLIDTPECRASLQNANAEACFVDQGQFNVNALWRVPEVGRPQPEAGAKLSYNIEQDRLRIENVTPALTGTFLCEYDLSTGNEIGDNQGGNCDSQLTRITDLIDEYLSTEN